MCPADRWGPLCDKPCPRDPSGLVCGGHGVCRAIDGDCDCFRDPRRGFWTGSLCSTCAATHANSPNCTLPCPIDNASQICSARGQCANGACRDCAPLASDGGVLVCGSACELRGDACRTNPCAVPKPGYWGANCSDVCPGGAATPCNNHGVCLSDGACSCQEGYSGIACDSLCPRGSSGVLCSGHGACRTAGCVCDAPYYGTACSAMCPGPVPTTADPTAACNGHSVTGGCESDGTCVCQLGYVGTECQYRCPGGSNPCNALSGAGTCNPKTGKCECLNNATAGRYAGADCMSCTQGAAGPTCSDACNTLSGTTVGKLCVCNVGFGGPACDRECPGAVRDPILPKTVVGYCSQHGLCLDGSSNNATCACDANYYMTNCSVLCTADVCLSQGMTNSQCNATTGACECQDNFEGHYSGTGCDACKLFYWGSTCALSCACSGNGGCDRDTGVCQCFQDDVRGHWGGDYCEACSAGYIGTQCTGLDIQMSSNANNSAYVTIEARGGGTAGSVYYMDDVTKFLFVGSYPVVVLNASVLPPTPLSAVPGGLDFGAPVVSIRAASASTLEVLVNHTGNATTAPTLERVIITRTTTDFTVISRTALDFTSVAVVRDSQTQHHAMRAQAAINGFEDATALFTLQYDTQTIILYDNLAAIVVAGSGSPSTFGVALPAELTAIYGARLDTNAQGQSVLVVSGTANSARYHGQTTWAAVITRLPLGSSNEWDVVNGNVDPISGCDVDSKGRMPCPSARACTLFHTTSQTDRVVCVVAAPRGPTVLTVTHTATNHSLVTVDPRTGRLVGAGRLNAAELLIEFAKPFEITAVAIDPVIDLGYIAFHTTDPTTGAEPSTVYKFSLSTLAPTGTYSFSRVGAEPEIVRSLTVLADTRELHAIAVLPFRTTVRSLNLFGVERVIPSVIDAAGHVVITITGEGFFTSSNGVTSCIFDAGGNSTVAATIINSSMITCTAPRNEDDGTTCRIINFNVEFNSRRTDTTNAPIARPNSAKLVSLLTEYGDAGFGSTHLATAITVTGIGFIRSDFARCRLRESNGRVRVFSTAPTYLNSTSVVCYQPLNSLPTLPPAYLEYAHDGQIFSAVSVLYAVAGDASRIDVKRPASKVIAMISAAVAVVPAFEVHVSDSNGNSLHWSADKPLGQGPYLAKLSPSNGFGTGPTLTLANGTQSLEPTVNGVATFDTVFLRAPRAGSYQLDITVNGDGALWLDSVTVVVTPGIPSKLAIVNLAAVMSVKVGSAASSAVTPIIVVTDAAGNEIRAGTDRFDLPQQVMLEYDLAEEEVSGDGETKTAKSTAQKIIADLSDGYFTFTAVPLRGFHGESYPLRFSAVVPAGVNAETHISSRIAPLETDPLPVDSCASSAEYAVAGTFTCLACPSPGGICNAGLDISVAPNYWRASRDSYNFYSCAAPYSGDSCIGGNCKAGYRGPRCSVCVEGYGKTGRTCQKCESGALNYVVMSCIGVFACIVVVGLVLNSVNHPDPRNGVSKPLDRLPLIVKMFANHVQLSSKLGMAIIAIPSELESLFQIQSSASSFDFNLSFIDCETRATYYQQYVGTLALVCVMVVVGVVGVVVVEVFRRHRTALQMLLEEEDRAIILDTQARRDEYYGDAAEKEIDNGYDAFADLQAGSFSDDDNDQPAAPAQHTSSVKEPARTSSAAPLPTSAQQSPATAGKAATPRPVSARSGGGTIEGGGIEGFLPVDSAVVAPGASLSHVDLVLSSGAFDSFALSPEALLASKSASSVGSNFVARSRDQIALLKARHGKTGLADDASSLGGDGGAAASTVGNRAADGKPRRNQADGRKVDAFGQLLAPHEVAQRQRFTLFEVVLVSIVITVFLFYQTIIEQSGRILTCERLDFGAAAGFKSVLVADRRLECGTGEHTGYMTLALLIMAAIGIGFPILSVGVAKIVAVLRMGGDMQRSRYLFFFMTGGYKDNRWFWEAIVMVRKALIALIVVGIADTKVRSYAAMWLLMACFLLNWVFAPHADRVLAVLETVSLLTMVVTLNAGMLFDYCDRGATPGAYWTLTVFLLIVNSMTMIAFTVAFFTSVNQKFKRLYRADPLKYRVLSCFYVSEAEEALKEALTHVQVLTKEIATMKEAVGLAMTSHESASEGVAHRLKADFEGVDLAMGALRRWDLARQDGYRHASLTTYTARDLEAVLSAEQQLANVYIALLRHTSTSIRRTEYVQ
jgi:type II secretory pathway pseudopilin PulG